MDSAVPRASAFSRGSGVNDCAAALSYMWMPRIAECVPVAQLDRALASGAKGCGFDSRQAHQVLLMTRCEAIAARELKGEGEE